MFHVLVFLFEYIGIFLCSSTRFIMHMPGDDLARQMVFLLLFFYLLSLFTVGTT